MKIGRRSAAALLAFAGAGAVYLGSPGECPEAARRTAAVFAVAAVFWAFEIVPLFATSLLVVVLLILLLAMPWAAVPGAAAVPSFETFLAPLASPVILLFFGGFVLARVLHRHGIDRAVVTRIVPKFGDRPYFLLLGVIFSTSFLGLWVSNTAATALMLAMIVPVLACIDADDKFRKALVLAVPFAASVGGIATPVGTPPNAITIGVLAEHGIRVPFVSWMAMGAPLALIVLLFTSVVLYRLFPPKRSRLNVAFGDLRPFTPQAKLASLVALGVIGLWLTSQWHGIPESVTALLGAAVFAALGLFDREDVRHIHWDILILMWGGLALGQAMMTSGLGEWVVTLPLFRQEGFWLVATFAIFTIVVSTLISNTATANLLVPLAMSLPSENRATVAVVVALACSFDMVLPVSTPPNAMAFATKEISAADLFKAGACVLTAGAVLILAGYPIFVQKILHLVPSF